MDTLPNLERLPPLRAPAVGGAWVRLLPTFITLIATPAVFVAAHFAGSSRATTLIMERGWTQAVTLALFFFGVGHVLRRLWVQQAERRALRICAAAVGPDPLDLRSIRVLTDRLHPFASTLAGSVSLAVLSHFRSHRPARDEVLDLAHKAVERCHDEVHADYRPLDAVMWLLPLSGFVGTVIGMAAAISSFDGVIASLGDDLSALGPAVQGLATAFDTTLLALILVIPLKVMEVGLDGRDRRLLSHIDATLGVGYVRDLDLAGLAQQSPLEAVLDRYAERVERIESAMDRIDQVMLGISSTLGDMPEFTRALSDMSLAAQGVNTALPELLNEVRTLRDQGEQPLVLSRGPRGA